MSGFKPTCSLCGCPTSWLAEEKCVVAGCPHAPKAPVPRTAPVAEPKRLICAGGCGASMLVPGGDIGLMGAGFTCEECRAKPPRKPTRLKPEMKGASAAKPQTGKFRRPPTPEELAAARQWVYKRERSKRAQEAGWLVRNGKTRLHWLRLTAIRQIMEEEQECGD